MEEIPTSRGAFVIRILSRQYSSWQGTITWIANQKTQPFRSALELIKFIDSALESERKEDRTG